MGDHQRLAVGKERLLKGFFLGKRKGLELRIQHELEQKKLRHGERVALLLQRELELGPASPQHEAVEGHLKGLGSAYAPQPSLIPKAQFEHGAMKKGLHRGLLPVEGLAKARRRNFEKRRRPLGSSHGAPNPSS